MHIIIRIPAWVITGLGPDGIAAPAVIDPVFTQIEPPIGDSSFTEHLFGNFCHHTRISRPVCTSVDKQNLELLSIVNEGYLLFFMDEFAGRTVTVGATPGRFLSGKDKTAYGALPGHY
jgi:hypothetical protein